MQLTLDLLHFAYLGSMGLWIVPYSLAGVALAAVASRRTTGQLRLASLAFVLALFFSLSLVVDRGAAPVPTLFALGLGALDTARSVLAGCQPSPEGCMPPEGGNVVWVVPFLVQWATLYGLLLAGGSMMAAWARRRP